MTEWKGRRMKERVFEFEDIDGNTTWCLELDAVEFDVEVLSGLAESSGVECFLDRGFFAVSFGTREAAEEYAGRYEQSTKGEG